MTATEQIVEAFRNAGRALTLEEVMDDTGLEDKHKVRGLIYFLVNKERLAKSEPTSDGASRWQHPEAAREGPPREVRVTPARAPKPPKPPTVAAVMELSMHAETLPHVCVNFGTGQTVISCGEDVIQIDSLTAAQNLHAQIGQAIAALEALHG